MLNYGIVGNCKTCALVREDTSIDWMCFPRFSSPSIFAKLLDEEKGGNFKIEPVGKYRTKQEYIRHTNILKTTFKNSRHEFEVIDFLPRYKKILPRKKNVPFHQNRIVRIVKPIKGNPRIKVILDPKLNYAKGNNEHEIVEDNLIFKNKNEEISLISNVDFDCILENKEVELNHTRYLVLGIPDEAKDFNVKKCTSLLNATKKYWRSWVGSMTLPEKNREIIIRSALLLKLLTYSETGAIVAAPTTSLPEEVGTDRTFDYRFCWVRDAAFTVDALKKIGRNHEAKKLMEFIFENVIKEKKHMQIMYGIRGETKLTEEELPHLDGYKGSKPVRIGNAAYYQKQNDIYGSIIDVMYLYYVYYRYEKMPLKYWQFLKYLVREIENNWQKEDHGIWEFRGEKKHFVYSKLMCYVGMSRAIRIAKKLKKTNIVKKWEKLKLKIKSDMIEKGWNDNKKAFTMYYGGYELDAAVLMMSYHDFLNDDDDMLVSTIMKINEELREDVFVKRYDMKDDFGKSDSAFTICSFWLVDSLWNAGKKSEAKKMFQKLVRKSNHVGLFSEDLDMKTGELLGNFPQAYTHIAIINSAILQSEWSEKRIPLKAGKNTVR